MGFKLVDAFIMIDCVKRDHFAVLRKLRDARMERSSFCLNIGLHFGILCFVQCAKIVSRHNMLQRGADFVPPHANEFNIV